MNASPRAGSHPAGARRLDKPRRPADKTERRARQDDVRANGGETRTRAALAAFDAKHKDWLKAVAARDALLLGWQKALTRYRVLAKASLIDDEGAYAALFAAPEGITVAKRKRKKAPAVPTA